MQPCLSFVEFCCFVFFSLLDEQLRHGCVQRRLQQCCAGPSSMATESKGAESGGVPGVLTAELRREAWDLADSITETVDMLSAARDRLKNSVSHLQSSNAQLVRCGMAKAVVFPYRWHSHETVVFLLVLQREALEACPDDADFLQAVVRFFARGCSL